jgi:hypothetical protein
MRAMNFSASITTSHVPSMQNTNSGTILEINNRIFKENTMYLWWYGDTCCMVIIVKAFILHDPITFLPILTNVVELISFILQLYKLKNQTTHDS